MKNIKQCMIISLLTSLVFAQEDIKGDQEGGFQHHVYVQIGSYHNSIGGEVAYKKPLSGHRSELYSSVSVSYIHPTTDVNYQIFGTNENRARGDGFCVVRANAAALVKAQVSKKITIGAGPGLRGGISGINYATELNPAIYFLTKYQGEKYGFELYRYCEFNDCDNHWGNASFRILFSQTEEKE